MANRTVTRLRLALFVVLAATLVPAVSLVAPSAARAQESAVDRDLDAYWGKKRDVRVIQKRLFLKDGRWEFTPFGGIIPNDEFFLYGPLGLRVAYFIDEDFSIEVNGAYLVSGRSDLEEFLEDPEIGLGLIVDLPQQLEWYAGANGTWSPIHGKFGIFTTKLTHFDIFLSFGAGAIGTKTFVRDEFDSRKVDIQGNLGLGFRLFLLDWLALRLEYRHYIYMAEGGGVSYPAELSLGVSFFTSAPQ